MAEAPRDPRRPIGQELIIPAMAVGFTAYYFWTVTELAWEAKANGVVIGLVLLVLVALLVIRIGVQMARGEVSLRATLGGDPATDRVRLMLLGLCLAFLVALPLLGTTIALALMLFACMWVLGARHLADADRRVGHHALAGLVRPCGRPGHALPGRLLRARDGRAVRPRGW